MAQDRGRIATRVKLTYPSCLATELTSYYAQLQEAKGEPINTHFIDFLPAVTKSMFSTHWLELKSLLVPLRACYLWRVRIQ